MKYAIAAAGAAFALVGAASADQESVMFEINLSAATTQSGAQAVYQSIERQAEDACHSYLDRPWIRYGVYLDCQDDLVDQIVAKVDMPLITALHDDAEQRQFAQVSN